jgi:hypothetical protein
MVENRIDLRTGTLFPWPFQLLAGIVCLAGLFFLNDKLVLGLCLIGASAFVFSGYSGIEIDKGEKKYREYMSFFFLKSGKEIKYVGVEKIFINSSQVRQQMHTAHTNHSSVYTNIEFNGFLKLEDGKKIHLLTRRKKDKLIHELKKIALFLAVPLDDTTQRQATGS